MKKELKIILGTILTVFLIWLFMFLIDYTRVSNLKMPIFVVKGEENTYYGMLYKVEVEKSGELYIKTEMFMFDRFIAGAITEIEVEPEKNNEYLSQYRKLEELPENYREEDAINDKCFISVHGRIVYNKNKLDSFLENVNNNAPDYLRTIMYTTEGNMIITDVNFEGNNNFKVCTDSTRDKFSTKEDRTYRYYDVTEIQTKEGGEHIEVIAKGNVDEEQKEILVTYYNKNYVHGELIKIEKVSLD